MSDEPKTEEAPAPAPAPAQESAPAPAPADTETATETTTVFQAAESVAALSVEDAPESSVQGGGSTAVAEEEGAASSGPTHKEGRGTRKSIHEILSLDAEDESLRKYKETLLGAAAAGGPVGDPNDPRRVIVTEFRIMFDPAEGR